MSDYIEESVRQYCYRVAHRLIECGKFSFEQIADIVDISLEEVTEISEHPEYFEDWSYLPWHIPHHGECAFMF